MSDRLPVTPWLLLEEGRLSGLVHMPSAVHWCQQDFRLLKLSFFLKKLCVLSCWQVKLPSPAFIRRLQILCVHIFWFILAVFPSLSVGLSFSCDTSGSLQLLVLGSSVWGGGWAAMLVTHGCVCLMGFYCLENAKERVTANLFNACVHVCFSQQLPAKQQAFFAASLRELKSNRD